MSEYLFHPLEHEKMNPGSPKDLSRSLTVFAVKGYLQIYFDISICFPKKYVFCKIVECLSNRESDPMVPAPSVTVSTEQSGPPPLIPKVRTCSSPFCKCRMTIKLESFFLFFYFNKQLHTLVCRDSRFKYLDNHTSLDTLCKDQVRFKHVPFMLFSLVTNNNY